MAHREAVVPEPGGPGACDRGPAAPAPLPQADGGTRPVGRRGGHGDHLRGRAAAGEPATSGARQAAGRAGAAAAPAAAQAAAPAAQRDEQSGCERGEYARNHMAATRRLIALTAAAVAAGPAAAAPTPPFTAAASTLTAADLPHSYRAGCPVPPSRLRLLRLSYWGFDRAPHHGSLVVNAAVVPAVERVFERLYAARFPIRRMQPVDAFGGSDDRSMAADNTSAFNCRAAVAPGPRRWSVHAYGEAIDVDPVENPYLVDGRVLPPAGRRYLDRVARPAGDGGSGRHARVGLRRGRVAVGRPVDGLARHAALLGDRRLRGAAGAGSAARRLTSVRRFRLHRRARWPRPPEGSSRIPGAPGSTPGPPARMKVARASALTLVLLTLLVAAAACGGGGGKQVDTAEARAVAPLARGPGALEPADDRSAERPVGAVLRARSGRPGSRHPTRAPARSSRAWTRRSPTARHASPRSAPRRRGWRSRARHRTARLREPRTRSAPRQGRRIVPAARARVDRARPGDRAAQHRPERAERGGDRAPELVSLTLSIVA